MEKEPLYWFTTASGVHVPVFEGETKQKALANKINELNKEKNKLSKDDILAEYRKIKSTGTHEELQSLANEINDSNDFDEQTKENMISKLDHTDLIHNQKRIEVDKTNKQKIKIENKNTVTVKDIKDKKKEINQDISDAIDSAGENGRFDSDSHNVENLYDRIYDNVKKTLGRDIKDNEFDFIDKQLESFYKDDMYVSNSSYSLKEYQNKVITKLDKVSSKLQDEGFEVKESHSQFAGLISSQYYTKDGVTVRIGDHSNSTGYSASHTRDELYKSSVNDLVKYVKNEYKKQLLKNKTPKQKVDIIKKTNGGK